MTLADVHNASAPPTTQHVRAEARREEVEAQASSDDHTQAKLNQNAASEKTPDQPKDASIPPQWVSDFLDAASSGGTEFRKEARKLIKAGYGAAMQALLEDMAEKAPEESKDGVEKMVKCVKTWVEKPEELEEGGRWWSYWDAGMFNNSWFSSFYMPSQMSWSWLPSSNTATRRTGGGQTTKYTSTW